VSTGLNAFQDVIIFLDKMNHQFVNLQWQPTATLLQNLCFLSQTLTFLSFLSLGSLKALFSQHDDSD